MMKYALGAPFGIYSWFCCVDGRASPVVVIRVEDDLLALEVFVEVIHPPDSGYSF